MVDFGVIAHLALDVSDNYDLTPNLSKAQKGPLESTPKFSIVDLAQANISNLQHWSPDSCQHHSGPKTSKMYNLTFEFRPKLPNEHSNPYYMQMRIQMQHKDLNAT